MARKSRVNIENVLDVPSAVRYKAAIYRRLSVEDGDDIEIHSLGNQEMIIKNYVMEYPEIEIVEVFTDNGYTGMNFKRPDFIRMKEDLLSGKINCVIVKDVSRLGRNFVLTSEYVERFFPEHDIRLICINDGYDSNDENADSAALMLPFKMIMNESYAKDTSIKIRSSINAMIDNGEYLPSCGSIPYGYIRNPEMATFDIDEEVSPVILLIFQLRSQRMPFNSIAKELNDRGIPCPGKLRYDRGITKDKRYETAVWIRGTIRKITNDIVYLGHRVHGRVKRDKLGMDKTRRPKEQWQIIENAHPAIIPQDLFELVAKINEEELNKRSNFIERAEPGVDYRPIFQDKLFCADCHSKMIAQKGCARHGAKTPSRLFYDCNGYRYSNHEKCSSHYIRQEAVMSAVTNLLNKQLEIAVDVEKLIQDIRQMPKVVRHQTSIGDQIQSCIVKKRNIESKIERLLMDLTEGLITREEYEYMKNRYSQQSMLIADEYTELKNKSEELTDVITTAQMWLSAIREYKKLPAITRELFETLVDKVYISSSQKVKIQLMYADPCKPIMDYLERIGVMRNVS